VTFRQKEVLSIGKWQHSRLEQDFVEPQIFSHQHKSLVAKWKMVVS